jgi:DMSO/TMAO reductase YedYZ molybdopterin-dependent catalytic subunit
VVFDQREAARIIRRPSPELSEMPVACARELLTPVDRFYRRHHFPEVPRVAAGWTVPILAGGRQIGCLTEATAAALPRLDRVTVLECAGNGGSGEHLKRGGFGVARWSGVRVASVLDGVDLSPSWTVVTFRGRDRGRDPDETHDVDYYQRSIPVEVALDRALLATHMNDVPLPPEHGHPLRLVVPGWYGSDWIKWVETIELSDRASADAYTTDRYRRFQDADGRSFGPMAREVLVKSMIGEPVADQYCCGGRVETSGLAWTGQAAITRVEVRVDERSWEPAQIVDEADGGAVVRWRHLLEDLGRGLHVVSSRATDSSGAVQPLRPHGRMYEANHVLATPVYCL